MSIARIASALLLAGALTIARAQSVPATLNYQGRLTDNGPSQTPVSATVPMQFALYDAPSGGAQLWQEPPGATTLPVSVTGGVFSVILGGNGVPLPAAAFNGSGVVYLEITAGGQTLAPRQQLTAASFARRAENSTSADNATTSAFSTNSGQLGGLGAANWQRATTQTCATGSFLRAIDPTGATTCATAASNLVAPVSISGAVGPAILTVTQNYNGVLEAGHFYNTNASNIAAALSGTHAAGGAGVYGYSETGQGGDFRTGSGIGLAAFTNSTGAIAAHFQNTNAGSITPTLFVQNLGSGEAGRFEVGNAYGLYALNNSTYGVSVYAGNSGAGPAGQFVSAGAGPSLIATASGGAGSVSLKANAGAAPVVPIVAQGAASQTANLQEWRNSAGTALSWVDSAGGFHGDGSALTGVSASALALPYAGGASAAGAGVFTITNSASINGGANEVAIKAVNGNAETSGLQNHTALWGVATASPSRGVGVEGDGSYVGVQGVVYGSAASGIVYGVSGVTDHPSGIGVWGNSSNAVGMWGHGMVGVRAEGSGTGTTALDIVSGAIKVTGAGLGTSTPVFIHKATAGTIGGNSTTITHPMADGDPNAILIVTPNWTAGGGVYDNHAIGVYYSGGHWLIFNQDGVTMPTNAAFNVLVVKP